MIDTRRLSRSVSRISVFDRDSRGSLRPVVLFDRRKKKKKQTKGLRPVERIVRTVADANDAVASTYARRHRRSNRKRRDGWLRDMLVNVNRAGNKGLKEYEVSRVLSW
jgi:ribosomal protein L20